MKWILTLEHLWLSSPLCGRRSRCWSTRRSNEPSLLSRACLPSSRRKGMPLDEVHRQKTTSESVMLCRSQQGGY